MTSATPKPRAGEHVPSNTFKDCIAINPQPMVTVAAHEALIERLQQAWAERDLLRERERELVEVLEVILRAEFGSGMIVPAGCESTYWGKARALLAKHGR